MRKATMMNSYVQGHQKHISESCSPSAIKIKGKSAAK